MKDKLHGATSDYSGNIWENIKKEIPIAKQGNGRYYWMMAFLFAFSTMIFVVQQYPNWKVNQQANEAISEVEALDVSKFILSPSDLASRQLQPITYPKPSLQPAINTTSKILTTKSTTLADDVPTLANLYSENQNNKVTQANSTNSINQSIDIDATALNADARKEDTQTETVNTAQKAPLYSLANISKFNIGLKIPTYTIPATRKDKKNDVHCEVLAGKQSKFYVTGRHVNSYAFNNLNIKNPSADDYMTNRHGSESKKYSFSDEVSFGTEYRNGLFVELGLRYDQINEQFNYLDANAQGQSTVVVSDTIWSGNMSEVIQDTVTTQLSGQREIVNNNRFRKISVPFSIGYQFPLNKKVSIAARSGLVLNVWSKYEGKMFDENFNVVSIDDRQNSSNPFFNKLVHSVSASAYLQYKMNKRMEFLVGLDGFRNLGSTSYDTNPIDQKYTSLGVFIGTKYNL